MSFAMPGKAALVAMMLGVTGSGAYAQPPQPPQQSQKLSRQSAFALQFLSWLERGRPIQAHAMLAPNVAREISIDKLLSVWPKRSMIPVDRRVRSETTIPLESAFADHLSRKRTGKGLVGFTAYRVCLAEVPRSGYGSVTYITVVLIEQRAWSRLRISEFRIQSEPEHSCKS